MATTARLGARKWAPRFDHILTQQAYVAMDENQKLDLGVFEAFKKHALLSCAHRHAAAIRGRRGWLP